MDAAEFLRGIKRMHDDRDGRCRICPIGGLKSDCYVISCIPEDEIDELVRRVEKWVEGHPVGCNRRCSECHSCYNAFWRSQEKEK